MLLSFNLIPHIHFSLSIQFPFLSDPFPDYKRYEENAGNEIQPRQRIEDRATDNRLVGASQGFAIYTKHNEITYEN